MVACRMMNFPPFSNFELTEDGEAYRIYDDGRINKRVKLLPKRGDTYRLLEDKTKKERFLSSNVIKGMVKRHHGDYDSRKPITTGYPEGYEMDINCKVYKVKFPTLDIKPKYARVVSVGNSNKRKHIHVLEMHCRLFNNQPKSKKTKLLTSIPPHGKLMLFKTNADNRSTFYVDYTNTLMIHVDIPDGGKIVCMDEKTYVVANNVVYNYKTGKKIPVSKLSQYVSYKNN